MDHFDESNKSFDFLNVQLFLPHFIKFISNKLIIFKLMKIIKRLPMLSTIAHRTIYAKPKDILVKRWFTKSLN